MSDQSANLRLPYLMPAQAQKHVTVNDGLRRLDALVQAGVESRTVSLQPSAPTDGQVWILPPGKTGATWDGYADGALAYYRDGAWEQLQPKSGWSAYVRDEAVRVGYDGAGWRTETLDPSDGLISVRAKSLAGGRGSTSTTLTVSTPSSGCGPRSARRCG